MTYQLMISFTSYRHCTFTSDKSSVYLEDLGATNPTTVNDKPVNGRVMLADKDIICVGHTRFEYRSLGRKVD
jgi:pSer/pThr/pTyr-binding forkhead associated (FHA) protein